MTGASEPDHIAAEQNHLGCEPDGGSTLRPPLSPNAREQEIRMTDTTFTTEELIKAQGFVIKLLITALDRNLHAILLSYDLHDAVDKLEKSQAVEDRDVAAIRSLLPRRS
jgi:hypothetical protein